MLRRFDQFQWGPLNATRLNELVDSIVRLQQQVAQMKSLPEKTKDRILVQIAGSPTEFGGDLCGNPVIAFLYPFDQVYASIPSGGPVDGTTCLDLSIPSDAISSSNGAALIAIEKEPSLKRGDVVSADIAPMGMKVGDQPLVYIAGSAPIVQGGSIRLARIIGGGNGYYECSYVDTGETVTVENLYETQGHYGALQAAIECAQISPKSIPADLVIWTFPVLVNGIDTGQRMTMTPTPFDSVCTCGSDAVSSLSGAEQDLADQDSGKGGAAANIITRLMGM